MLRVVGVFLSHHCVRVTACPTFPLLADLSKVIRMLLKKNCKCQLPFIISREGNPTMKLPERKPVVFSMFLSTDLFLLFYKRVFSAVKKVRCDPFEVLVFHCISVCFWSSVILAINSLMQSAQCLPAHTGSVCCC